MSIDSLVIIAVQVVLFAVSYGTMIQRVRDLEEDVQELQVYTGLRKKSVKAGG